ncbi:hypothetical protein B0H13DRAFT_1884360 [Mycena leptocephala]|nr:hypothetical protein B0H13DRAFT_1884360 [Mycena leptocephala]
MTSPGGKTPENKQRFEALVECGVLDLLREGLDKTRGRKKKRDTSVGTNTSPPQGSRSTLPIHTPSGSRALAHSRKGPELQRAARGRAIQRVRVSRAAWRLVAELHGIFERACIGSRRGWMASGGDGGGVRDEKRVPRPLQPADTVGGGCVVVRWAQARVEQRRRDWSEDAHGAGGPDGGAGAEHQGTQTQLLRMHLVLRVVRSGCTAGVSFERRDSIGQDTVAVGGRGRRRLERREPLARHVVSAGGGSGRDFNVRCAVWSVWERDVVKDATLESVNRASVRREVHRTVKDNEGRSGRGRGRSREKRRERGEKRTKIARFPLTQIHRRRGELGTSHRCQYVVARTFGFQRHVRTNRPHLKNLNVEDQWELGRGKGQAGARHSVSTGRGKEYSMSGVRGCLREKILSQGLALSSGG